MVVLDFGIVSAQANIGPLDFSEPSLLYISKVPHKAKEVLVEPVLLLIVSINVLVPPQVHTLSPGLGGNEAPTNSKSLEVQELAAGKFCANDWVEMRTKKTARPVL